MPQNTALQLMTAWREWTPLAAERSVRPTIGAVRSTIVSLLGLSLCGALISCPRKATARQPEGEPADKNRTRIQAALTSLLQRPDDNAVVIVTDPKSHQVVFVVSTGGGLVLSLLADPLDDAERARARRFFAALGVKPTIHRGVNVSTRQAVQETAFDVDFGKKVARATEVAVEVFKEVYSVPSDVELTVDAA